MPALVTQPFAAARDYAAGRTLLPTVMSSAELAQLTADTRAGAVFCSGVTEVEFLQVVHDRTAKLAAGTSAGPGDYANPASVRTELKELLGALDYQPAAGDEGTIKDLRTDARLNLIVNTQLAMVTGYGQWRQSFLPGAALLYPCAEFRRRADRNVPRGYRVVGGALVEVVRHYWQRRWVAAGGRLFAGRMVARLDDPVWPRLSRFGHPWDPCDFNTGYGREAVGRAEAVELGVIAKAERVGDGRFAEVGSAKPEVRSEAPDEAGSPKPEVGSETRPAVSASSATPPLLTPAGFPRLINVFTAGTAALIPALREALVARLRGLFHLDESQRLVADRA